MTRRPMAHRADDWNDVTFWEVVRSVLLALLIVAALYGLLLLADAVWG
jgi:hypothetical protein